MASLVCRRMPLLAGCLSRAYFVSAVRNKKVKLTMSDPVEHATGLEKWELQQILAGNENPFDMRVYERGPATKEAPMEVPSGEDTRIIGCICEEDQTFINYMLLYKGETKRCSCGYWFKLVERNIYNV